VKNLKLWAAVLVGVGVLMAGGAWAFELPRILAEIRPLPLRPWNDNEFFGREFCCPGDVNGDGVADLLVVHGVDTVENEPNKTFINIYLGGNQISEVPAMVFDNDTVQGEFQSTGSGKIFDMGQLIPGHGSLLGRVKSVDRRLMSRTYSLLVYECGEALDTIPDYRWTWCNQQGPRLGYSGKDVRPGDLNGDGATDLLAFYHLDLDSTTLIQIFYGGNQFDTIPDWQTTIIGNSYYHGGIDEYRTGFDVNGDGCDDFLFRSRESEYPDSVQWHSIPYYYLFLGGEGADTLPVFRISSGDFQEEWGNRSMDDGFTMLKDINHDGYDDWAIYWEDWIGVLEECGVYVFYGSEHPDIEPDLNLEGNRSFLPQTGDIMGGDFNGDGYNDVALMYNTGPDGSEIHYHFGPWISETPNFVVNVLRDIQDEHRNWGDNVGAVGDYNGDGADDFVTETWTVDVREPYRLVIVGGDRGWRVDVDDVEQPARQELSLSSSPNPFNSSTIIRYFLPSSLSSSLSLFDTNGRLIRQLFRGAQTAGEHTVTVEGVQSGVYLVVLQTPEGSVVKKVVCVR